MMRFAPRPGGPAMLLAAAVAGCGGKPPDACTAMLHLGDQPLEQRGEKLLAHMRINGGDAYLIVDTGADDNVLRKSAARRLGLSLLQSHVGYAEGFGGQFPIGTATASDVGLAGATGRALAFTVTDDDGKGGEVDGLLGMDLLGRMDVDLDLWGNKLGLYAPLARCREPRTALAGPLYGVALRETQTDTRPIIDVTINGITVRALIDSGLDRSLIFRRTAERLGLVGNTQVVGSTQLRGLGPRVVDGELVVSPPIQLGDLTLSHLPVTIADQARLGDTGVVLGYDFISHVHVWISHSSRTLIMQYPPSATPAVPP